MYIRIYSVILQVECIIDIDFKFELHFYATNDTLSIV